MATVWSNSRLKEVIEKITYHHKIWLLYAIFSPIIIGFTTLLFYLAESTPKHLIFWGYISLIALSSAGWWFWTMWVIKQITMAQITILSIIRDVSSDLKDIKSSVLDNSDLTKRK